MSELLVRIKKYKFQLVVAILLGGLLLVAIVVDSKRVVQDTTTPTFVVKQDEKQDKAPQLSWNGVIPGVTKIDEISSNLGNQLSEQITPQGLTETTHDGVSQFRPIHVVTDDTTTIQYLKNPQEKLVPGDYGVYVKNNNLSKPNLSLYKKGHQDYERVHVFLDNGVAIEVYVAEDGSAMISAFRWFEPTTKEEFMSRWGTDLVEKFVPEGN